MNIARQIIIVVCGLTSMVVIGSAQTMPRLPALTAKPLGTQKELSEAEEIQQLLTEGYNYLAEQYLQKAMSSFERVLIMQPDNKRARFGVSTVYVQLKEYKLAMKLWEAMLRDYPEDYTVMNNMAWLCATADDPDIQDPERGKELAKQALLNAPGNYHVWSTLAAAYYESGEYEKALETAQKALNLAHERKADEGSIVAYELQIADYRRARQAFSIFE